MLNLGTDEIVKYPFLAEAGKYLKDKRFTLEQFGNDPDQKIIIDKAYNRICSALDNNVNYVELNDVVDKDLLLSHEVFSFIISVILLKSCGINVLTKKFSLAEAKRAEKYLEKDLEAKIDIHSDNIRNQREYKINQQDIAIKIMRDLFSVNIQKKYDYFVVTVPNYLIHAVNFHESEWKLVNRYISRGFVFLSSHETVRLVRKELDNYIFSKIQSTRIDHIPDPLKNYIKKLLIIAKKFSTSITTSTDYPPCIKHTLDTLRKGENLSHSGRFLLATFLLGRGKNIKEISELFKNAPDYNRNTTLYQLNHLAGITGSRKKYYCPSCKKIKSQNLCFEISECNNIRNPIQFGNNLSNE